MRIFSFVLYIAFAVASLPYALAQTSAVGAIAGTVQDNSQAVVPGATVTVTSAAATSQVVMTDENGAYRVQGLSAGAYKVTISAPGFQNFESPNVAVTAGETTRLDATIILAGVSTSVNVQSEAATQIQTESSQITGEITPTEIASLGLNGRNFTQLAALTPGVSNQSGQDEALVGVKGSVKYSVNGGRTEYNTYNVDGGDILNAAINGSSSALIVYPSLDAISDMQVLTSNYGAMYGRSASGTIIATTKSGTGAFHGDGYFYLRNNHLNARNFFDPGTQAPLYQKYDQGGTIGGPFYIPGHYNAKKDKTFIFWSEEYHHDREPQTFNQGVPSMQERDCSFAPTVNAYCGNPVNFPRITQDFSRYGDFSDVCPSIPHQLGTGVNGGVAGLSQGGSTTFTRAQYPDCPGNPFGSPLPNGQQQYQTYAGNLVPIDPISQEILNSGLIPAPTPGATQCNSSIHSCYVQTVSPLTTWREELFRIDQNFSSREKVYFRYIHDAWKTVSLTPQWGYVQNSFPTVQNQFVGPGLSMVAHWTSTPSNSVVNDASMSFTTDHISLTDIPGSSTVNLARPSSFSNPVCGIDTNPNNPGYNSVTGCGMGSIFAPNPSNPFGGKLPGIVIGGTNAAYGGKGFVADPSYMPWYHSNPTYNIREDATVVHGKHTFSFGIQVVIAQRNEINPPVGANNGDVQGIAYFTNINNRNTSGNAFADFLGTPAGQQNFSPTLGLSPQVAGPPSIQAFQQDSGQSDYHNNYNTVEPYFQDDWQVSRRFTLNLGVRLSLFGLYHEKYLHSYDWVSTQFSSVLAGEVAVDPKTGALVFNDGTPVPINLSNLDPHLVNGINRCGVTLPPGCMTNHWLNPAPRVGFAWDPTGKGKTSIRAGYGIFFEHGTGNEANTGSLEGSPGYPGGVLDMTQYYPSSWGCIGDPGSLGNTGRGLCKGTAGIQGAFPLNVTEIPTKVVWPFVQQWSFSVQRQLPGNFLGSIAYVGSRGSNLTADLQVNQLVPVNASQNPFQPGQPLDTSICNGFNQGVFKVNGTMIGSTDPGFVNLEAACAGVNNQIPTPNSLRQPGTAIAPGMGQIFDLQNIANSTYHALQVTVRRSAGPLVLGVAYSYSHSIDDASDRTSAQFINAYNLDQNRASSDFDQRHLLNINYVVQLSPVFRKFASWLDEPLAGEGRTATTANIPSWVKHFFGGWQLSGITIFSTGTPFTVLNQGSPNGISSADNAGVAAGLGPGSYPDVISTTAQPIGNTSGGTGGTFGPLLGNPVQFVAPTGLTYGNAGRNDLRNPNQFNFDVSFIKDIQIRESKSLEFRLETYNVFNNTQFRIYDPSNPGNTGNNVISCYGSVSNTTAILPVPIPANSAGDSSCTGTSSFLHPVDAHRARTMQLAVKFFF